MNECDEDNEYKLKRMKKRVKEMQNGFFERSAEGKHIEREGERERGVLLS